MAFTRQSHAIHPYYRAEFSPSRALGWIGAVLTMASGVVICMWTLLDGIAAGLKSVGL